MMKNFKILIIIMALGIYYSGVKAQKEVINFTSADSILPGIQSSFLKVNNNPKIFEEGIKVFKELVAINPNDKDWNYYLGMCYYNLDRQEEAEKYLLVASQDMMYKIKIFYLKEIHDTRCVKL